MSQRIIDAAFNVKMGSPAGVIVAVYLAIRAADDGSVPWITYGEIGGAAELSPATILQAIDTLQGRGLLEAELEDDRARFQWNMDKIGGAQ